MTAKISATRAAEPKADKRPISTPVPVAVLESDVVGYVYVKELRLVLVLVLGIRRLLVKPYARSSIFRRERWLEMTDILIGGGGGCGRDRGGEQTQATVVVQEGSECGECGGGGGGESGVRVVS